MITEFGQDLSSSLANQTYLLKTEDDIVTGILSLQNGLDVNKHLSDLQEHIYTIGDIIGIIGENDPNAKIYTSTNFVANGDSRKVAIEKLDVQMQLNVDNIASNLTLITNNANDIQAILDSIGAVNGICPLDANAKIPAAHLPDVLLEYKGVWDASTNTPTLSDGTGSLNDWYRVNVAGTVDLGSGPITFEVNDKAVHNGTIWEKWDTVEAVQSVNGKLGAVVLDKTDVGLSNVTDDAQLKRSGSDWTGFTEKVNLANDDSLLIEDSEDSGNKKTVKISSIVASNKETIANNSPNTSLGISYQVASFYGGVVEYIVTRGANIEYGRILLYESSPAKLHPMEKVGDAGISFDIIENAGVATLEYTSSNDVAGDIRYFFKKFGA